MGGHDRQRRTSDRESPLTPHIARLAEDGASFERSYCPFPLCTPSRASLFSGNFPCHTRVVRNETRRETVPPELPRLGRLLRDSGYETGYFGKDHSCGVAPDGFEDGGSIEYDGPGYLNCGNLFDPVFTRDCVEFIQRPREKPFAVVLSLINPHDFCRIPPNIPFVGATAAAALAACVLPLQGQALLVLDDPDYEGDFASITLSNKDAGFDFNDSIAFYTIPTCPGMRVGSGSTFIRLTTRTTRSGCRRSRRMIRMIFPVPPRIR